MTQLARQEYAAALRGRYGIASKKQKGETLDGIYPDLGLWVGRDVGRRGFAYGSSLHQSALSLACRKRPFLSNWISVLPL